MARPLPNAKTTTTATIAKEILRAFMFLLSLQSSIVAGCGNGKSKSKVNKEKRETDPCFGFLFWELLMC